MLNLEGGGGLVGEGRGGRGEEGGEEGRNSMFKDVCNQCLNACYMFQMLVNVDMPIPRN